jgi:hypothetical protein
VRDTVPVRRFVGEVMEERSRRVAEFAQRSDEQIVEQIDRSTRRKNITQLKVASGTPPRYGDMQPIVA